jgi:hypothetical protein
MMNQEKFFVLYSSKYGTFFFFSGLCQYRWWGLEVCSSGHVGGERGCYMCTWTFSNISVSQSLCVSLVKMIVNTCGF